MGWAHALRNDTIMTRLASANHFGMIDGAIGNGYPGGIRCMTGLTVIAGVDMGGAFAAGNNAIMAADAGTNDLRMIDDVAGNGGPDVSGMAGFTDVGGVDMSVAFACRSGAIMTGDAGLITDIGVIESAGPANDVVTSLARQGCRYMSRPHTGGDDAVVTTLTSTNNLIVINNVSAPGDAGTVTVAGFAQVSGGDMRSRFTDDDAVVMTVGTGTHDFVMIDNSSRYPGDSAVTGLAFVGGADVGVTHAAGDDAIMTTKTGANDLVVIDTGDRNPGADGMTCITYVGAGDVAGVFTDGDDVVVTANADVGFEHAVVEQCNGAVGKAAKLVTRIALGVGGNVVRLLANGKHPIVTTVTTGRQGFENAA